jgi:hypothetical protein
MWFKMKKDMAECIVLSGKKKIYINVSFTQSLKFLGNQRPGN